MTAPERPSASSPASSPAQAQAEALEELLDNYTRTVAEIRTWDVMFSDQLPPLATQRVTEAMAEGMREELLRLLAQQQPAQAPAESISIDEYIRREGPNWEGVGSVEYVRGLRGGAAPEAADSVTNCDDMKSALVRAAREVLHRADECGFTRQAVMTDFSLSLRSLASALADAGQGGATDLEGQL